MHGLRGRVLGLAWESNIALTLFVSVAFGQSTSPTIKVLEGNGALNNISRRAAYAPLVQVVDANDQPLAQVPVVFTVPALGPGGRFGDGGTTLTVVTDREGKAAARGLVPNNTPGPFEIRVTARHEGRTARATINQTNAFPVKAGTGNTRRLVLIGLIAGAAAGGLLATQSGGGDVPSAARPPSSADVPGSVVGVVSPGQPGFGPPQ